MQRTVLPWLPGSLITLLILLVLLWPRFAAARPPRQEGDQPDFRVTIQSSPDGSTLVEVQEGRLDTAYFTAIGSLEDLAVGANGLALAEGQSRGTYSSGTIVSPLALTTDLVPMWAADQPEGTEIRLETRLSLDGGESWSDWLDNPVAFYPVRDNRYAGHLIWAGGERVALQFRVTLTTGRPGISPVFKDLWLVFSDTSHGPADGAIAAQMAEMAAPAATCPVPRPVVVSRTGWGCPDGENSPRRPPTYAPVTHIILHQAETPNTPGPYQDWAGWVRSVWNYHANILGWGDVGYNYIIDPNGTIYEGRAGGDDVVGIHDRTNRGSMAIGFLGCYGNCDDPRLEVAEPSPAMLDRAAELIAWKLGQKGIDPTSSGPYAGQSDVPVIAGGRDVVPTTSPGDNIYDRLPELRLTVAERTGCTPPAACEISVISDKPSYRPGETVNLIATVTDNQGTLQTGALVTTTVTRPDTSETGPFSFSGTGPYTLSYADTGQEGTYRFQVGAVPPTDQNLSPCTTEKTIPVAALPDSVLVKVNPISQTISRCAGQQSTTVGIQNVTGLRAVDLELRFDPGVLQVVDSNPDRAGVQVSPAGDFLSRPAFIAQQEADNAAGSIRFVATLLGSDLINGASDILRVDWRPQAAGVSPWTLAQVTLVGAGGQAISHTVASGTVQVTANCGGPVVGIILLQGRNQHGGVIVRSETGEETQTAADGSFSLSSGGRLGFTFPGYLSATVDPSTQLTLSDGEPEQARLGTLTLLAGDINGDDVINIYDLAAMATRYQSRDGTADLNGDGVVNILDLALAAGNYQRQGPLTEWQ